MWRKLHELLGKTQSHPKKLVVLKWEVLKDLNIALLAKWWWRLKKEDASLWVTTIKAIHGFFRRSPRDPLLSKKGGTWGTIISINNLTQEYGIDLFSLITESGNGSWVWSLHQSGVFSVASFRCLLDSKILHNNLGVQTYWSKLIPGKVNLHRWKTQHKRLATFDNLLKRGILSDPKPCPFYATSIETEDYIFAEAY